MIIDLLIFSFLTFLVLLWLTCVSEAFDSLSGGRIRKIESKNEKLAAKLETWMEQDDSLRAVLRLLIIVSAAVLGILILLVMKQIHIPNDWVLSAGWNAILPNHWQWFFAIVFAAICSCLCEIFARFILFRLDLFLLRISIPVLSMLTHSVFYPLKWGLEKITRATEGWNKHESPDAQVSVEDEILSYVESYNDDADSDLEEGEKQMIRGILEIGDMSVREIMTPRVDLFALPGTASIDEAKKLFIQSGHSRIPVYGRSIDEIRGIIYAKDFLDENAIAGKSLLQLAHPPIFIPETKEVAELLEEIKRSRNHFAVIIDEFGGTSGIVTFEDIIEEIVGEVHDEYDIDQDFKNRPQLMPDGSIVVEARTPISDINDIAEVEIPENDDTDTIGGYICSELGRIPEKGTEFVIPGQLKATILNADTRKINTIRLEL